MNVIYEFFGFLSGGVEFETFPEFVSFFFKFILLLVVLVSLFNFLRSFGRGIGSGGGL